MHIFGMAKTSVRVWSVDVSLALPLPLPLLGTFSISTLCFSSTLYALFVFGSEELMKFYSNFSFCRKSRMCGRRHIKMKNKNKRRRTFSTMFLGLSHIHLYYHIVRWCRIMFVVLHQNVQSIFPLTEMPNR